MDDEVTTEHISQIEQKLSPEVYPMSFLAQTKLERIELVLDSGANEFMLSNADLVTSLESQRLLLHWSGWGCIDQSITTSTVACDDSLSVSYSVRPV